MKETQEFTGKDLSEAVEKACSTLSVSKNDLAYEVITQGTTGIFGIVGRKDAKILVTLPKADAKAAEAVDAASDEEMEGIRSMVDEAFGEKTRLAPVQKPEEPEEEDNGRWDATPAPRSGLRGPGRGRQEPIEEPTDSDLQEASDPDPEKELPPAVPVTQASIDLGLEALQKMADLITDDAQIEAVTDQDRLTLKITGGNAGILIGRKGQTLDAMQFLTDKIINRKSEARVRVKVDIEGYMETRKTNLKQLAYKMADKAKKTGRPATINQMSAQDRRIVHLALKDDSQVRTQSMGDGYYRRLVIFPKKKNAYRGKRRFRR